jgi:multisubunit Na+/H+ antiporter MnhC subunit
MDSDEEENWMELFVYTLVGVLFVVGVWPAILVAGLIKLPFTILSAGINGIRKAKGRKQDVVPRERLRAE